METSSMARSNHGSDLINDFFFRDRRISDHLRIPVRWSVAVGCISFRSWLMADTSDISISGVQRNWT
jgi:hypothetical protein